MVFRCSFASFAAAHCVNNPERYERAAHRLRAGVKETFTRYDSADYLKSEEDIAAVRGIPWC